MKKEFMAGAIAAISMAVFIIGCERHGETATGPANEGAIVDDALVLKPAGEFDPPIEEVAGAISAPVVSISRDLPLPEGLTLSAAANDLLSLVRSGSEPALLISFISNCRSSFGLGAEQIIFFNDIGIPGAVISAMLEHDHSATQLAESVQENLPQYGIVETPLPPATPEIPSQEADYQNGYVGGVQPIPISFHPPPSAFSDTDEAAPFYQPLSPYGEWVEIGGMGKCWQPSVARADPSWQPYFDRGHWVNSDQGCYWLSEYSWGWAPFHYGRWVRHQARGWCWKPDHVWGPAWVVWRAGKASCGWAPLPVGAVCAAGGGFLFEGRRVTTSRDLCLTPAAFRFIPIAAAGQRNLKPHQLPTRENDHNFAEARHEFLSETSPAHLIAEKPASSHNENKPVPVDLLLRIPGQSASTQRPRGNSFGVLPVEGSERIVALTPGGPAIRGDDHPAMQPGNTAVHSAAPVLGQASVASLAPQGSVPANMFYVQRSTRPASGHQPLTLANNNSHPVGNAEGGSVPFWMLPKSTNPQAMASPRGQSAQKETHSVPVNHAQQINAVQASSPNHPAEIPTHHVDRATRPEHENHALDSHHAVAAAPAHIAVEHSQKPPPSHVEATRSEPVKTTTDTSSSSSSANSHSHR